MAYLGEGPNPVNRGLARKDTFTGDGSTTTFDLATAIPNVTENDIEVFVDNVRQEPGSSDAYTLGFDGSSNFKRITFTSAPASSAEIYVISGSATTRLLAVADGSVTADKLAGTLDLSSKTITLASSFTTNTGSQTLTNKSIDLTDNTLTGTTAEFNTALSDGSFATLAGSEVLTNKTIDASSNTLSNIGNSALTNSSITINGSAISLGGSVSTGTQWQSVVVADGSTTTSAVAGYGYFIDTTSATHTITLPSSPSQGDEISIIDYAGTFDSNNLTVSRNGNPIQGSAADLTVATERAGFTLVYVDGTQGWLLRDK
jgi:hypothetical protein